MSVHCVYAHMRTKLLSLNTAMVYTFGVASTELCKLFRRNWNKKMKAYHTYSAVDVAWSLLKHAKEQGKCFSNLQL